MRRQAEVAYVSAVGEAGHDHVPAEHALRAAEEEQAGQLPAIAGRAGATDGEPSRRQREGNANQPADLPVQPFPEIDLLELGEAHAGWASPSSSKSISGNGCTGRSAG